MKHVLMAVLNIMDKKSIIGDLPQFYVFNPNQVERMPISTGFIILVNDKIRMFAEEPQPQEYSIRRTLKYDTSTFHLPRQAKVRQFMSEVVGWCGANRCKPSHSLLPFDYG